MNVFSEIFVIGFVKFPGIIFTMYQTSDYYYGSGRVWGVGSDVKGDKRARVMEFLDWLASPEGLELQHEPKMEDR